MNVSVVFPPKCNQTLSIRTKMSTLNKRVMKDHAQKCLGPEII